MKGKNNGGFSLVEILVAMAILASVVIPVCSSMVLAVRVNGKAEAMMKARLAVSSAVETLMAEGAEKEKDYESDFPGVKITVTDADEAYYYNVVVEDEAKLVTVTTTIRAAGGGSQ